MKSHIDIQHASHNVLPVTDDELTTWASIALDNHHKIGELTLRFVDLEEITQLNYLYRHQKNPTNVLSFPATYPDTIELELPLLGDVVICPHIIEQESNQLKKPLKAHYAHIILHGILHLLGYDHTAQKDTEDMQALEIQLLAKLNFNNPYKP